MEFSIIIPVHNAEKHVSDCMKSVLKQTCRDYEFVLIDDGSTDDTGRICDTFAASDPERIKVIHQKNSRQLQARINGIRKATGKYCVFLDSDDRLLENALTVL